MKSSKILKIIKVSYLKPLSEVTKKKKFAKVRLCASTFYQFFNSKSSSLNRNLSQFDKILSIQKKNGLKKKR